MAKTQLKNYVFKPGIGANDNRFPNAYNLINSNKTFIQKEMSAYVAAKITSASQYTPTAANYNPNTGVMELTIFASSQFTPTGATYIPATGIMTLTIPGHGLPTGSYIRLAESSITFRCALDGFATDHAYPRSNGNDPVYNKPIRILSTTPNTIAVNVGYSSDTSTHTFVSASSNAVSTCHPIEAGDAVTIAQDSLTFTCALDGDATTHTYPRASGSSAPGGADYVYDKAIEVISITDETITVNVGISSNTSTHSFVSATANAVSETFFGYVNTSEAKCERDVGYIIDAYLHDLRYGGNESLYNSIKYYWDQDVAQVDGDRGAEIAAHNFIKRLIKDYIFKQIRYPALNSSQAQTITGSAVEATSQFTASAATYTPTTGDMTITIGEHSLAAGDEIFMAPDSITFTCALDGGATTHAYPRASGVPNTKGKDPFYYAPIIITAVTANTVTVNVGISSDTSVHTFHSATANGITAGPDAKINTLAYNTVDVIANGLNSMPTKVETGVGTVKIQGKYNTHELLLITNTTKNEIVYSFNNPNTGGSIEINDNGTDENFSTFLQTTDGVTTLTLNYNTSTHSSTDELQIFVEEKEVRTRPYDFGTDAIERNRTAEPKSMLDADFEYGLQPTKWSAIGTMRGYPSVYEIPGTDTNVLKVTTDASEASDGIGQSLITVETVGPHGFVEGIPITIKALENSITGAARAEGSFVIDQVPSATIFKYYAKAKVGVAAGEILSTTYTQLRQAGFYTGASIGFPQFTIASNGSSGTLFAELDIPVGSTVIPFDGPAPEVGSPVTNPNIPTGSQVTGIIDNSAGGGTYITPTITETVNPGENRVYLDSTVGVLANLAADRGDGQSINIATVGADYIDFNGNFTSELVPNKKTYSGVTGTNQNPAGTSATFDVGLTGNPTRDYTVTVNTAGTGYAVGDRIIIDGILVGGQSGINDINISVTGIDGVGAITTITFTGAHWDGTLSLTGVTATTIGGQGSGARFDLNYSGGAYTSIIPSTGSVNYTNPTGSSSGVGFGATYIVSRSGTSYSIAITNGGQDYAQNDTITILGDQLGGATPANDATVTVDSVDGSGGILTASIAGTAFDTSDASTGYVVNDIIKILGSELGGIDEFNDVYITVDSVGGSGNITSVSFNGTPPPLSTTYTSIGSATSPYTYNGSSGDFAIFNITNSNGTYAVSIVSGGQDYIPTETFTVSGSLLGGTSPTNDATITIDNVGGTGDITAASITGAGSTDGSIQDIVGSNHVGTGATFDVEIVGGAYTVAINSAGTNYGASQQLRILGSSLSGATPTNDITITITSVDDITTGVITAISHIGTPATAGSGSYTNVPGTNDPANGTGATFSIAKNFDAYDTVSADVAGSDYKAGDRIIIAGTEVDGTSPENDIVVTVATVGLSGDITGLTFEYDTANYGSNLDLISTILITEGNTGAISKGDSITYSALATLEIEFQTPHGFVPGDTFITTINSDDGLGNNHNLAGGSFFVTDIPTIYTLRYTARTAGAIDVSTDQISGIVYPRPDSFFIHRPYDGGVQLGTGGPQHGAQAIRQSKKYIRYQSGKGIMYTTGALFAPSYDLKSVTADGVEVGSTITITTDDNDHGVQVGGIIRLLGVVTPGYNSGNETAVPPKFDYEVIDVVNERTFKVRAQRRLGSTTAELGFAAQMSVVSWHGATVRSGIFDDQNGIFWEYDGTNVSVNQRTGTKQVAGTIAVGVDSNFVTGVDTRFRDQLKAGDRIIIKGMTHVVTTVFDNNSLAIAPDWRGVTAINGAKMNLVVDKKVKQSDFNLDRLDGTGPSGYNIDIAKMQMIGIQYSWYGAGFIDFMLRGSDGNFVFCHRMRNSNVNTEAFMRSGNLPVRYEVTNEGPPGKLSENMTDSQTTVPLEDASFFPDSGTVYIDNEIISFEGKSGHSLINCVRNATMSNFQAGADRVYRAGAAAIHDAGTGVVLISNTITPLISHWGSAFLTDGGFDEDRGYIFSYSETGVEVSTTKRTAFMIRLAPSVSNAIIGDLGERELLNRAQLLLQGLEITSDGFNDSNEPIKGGIVVEGVLNPQNYPLAPGDVGWGELSGVAQGGQPSFAQIASGGGISWNSGDTASYQTAAVMPKVTTTATLMSWSRFSTRNNYAYFTEASWETANLSVGDKVNADGGGNEFFPNGTVITAIIDQTQYGRYLIYFSQRANTNSSGGATQTFEKGGDETNASFAYFTRAAWEAAGAKPGTTIGDASGDPTNQSDISMPANSAVSAVDGPFIFGNQSTSGIEYYKVTFNNSYNGTLSPGDLFNFEFAQPPFAQPGETVFSYIANPGERSTLELGQLKELTNTPLGGRGTFPNGPDVLAINVYKVSGAPINANIVLKWGEAQA
jgi:hypothetical protein